MVSEIHDNNRVCDENGGILSCDGTYEGDKKFMQFKKEKNEMFEFYKKKSLWSEYLSQAAFLWRECGRGGGIDQVT